MRRIIADKNIKSVCLVLLSALTIWVLGSSRVEAKDAFPSKPISFIVPVAPGGGFDTFTRLIVPYLKKYLPGNPNIVVLNIPGGEWNIGISKMYRAKPDGHTIGILNIPGNAISQVLGTAHFDMRKITWLGNIDEVTTVTALSTRWKNKTLEDLKKAPEIIAGTVGLSSTDALGTMVASQRIGIKMRLIPHDGSQMSILSAIRGDIDWVQYPFSTLKNSIVDSKDLIPLMVYDSKRLSLLPDVPTVAELGYGDLVDVVKQYRPVGGPPGLPEDITKIWRDVFWKATNDPEYQKKQLAAKGSPRPMKPEELNATIENSLKLVARYEEIIKQHRK